jgi:hypothetical protein
MKPVELDGTHAAIRRRRACRTPMGRFARDGGLSRHVKLTVTTRQPSPKEERQFSASFDLLVAEMVRHELAALREKKP